MATKRIKDLTNTAASVASDAYLAIDGTSNGTEKITRDNFRQDTADAFVAAPGTYNLAPLSGGAVEVAKGGTGATTAAGARTNLEVNSKYEDAQANALKTTAPALYFNGSSSVVTVADDDKLSFTDGTDDLPFSISAFVKMTDAINFRIVGKYLTTNNTREWNFGTAPATGTLRLQLRDASGFSPTINSNAALTSYEGQWIHVAATFGGAGPNSSNAFAAAMASNSALYINGVAVVSTTADFASYAGMSNTTADLKIGYSDAAYAKGSIRDVKIFNRELTTDEIAELARGNDLGFADEWGGAEVYTGDSSTFTSSLGNWTIEGTGITVTQSGGAMVVTNTAASSGTRGTRNIVDTLTEGKRYRCTFTCQTTSGTGQQIQLTTFNSSVTTDKNVLYGSGMTAGSAGSAVIAQFIPTGTNEQYSVEFVIEGGATETLYFNLNNTGAGEVYEWADITVTEIGTLADFRAEDYNESASKLLDRSSNNFVGVGTSVTLTGNQRHISADTIDLKNLPTSSAGLSAGEVWSNGGVLTVV